MDVQRRRIGLALWIVAAMCVASVGCESTKPMHVIRTSADEMFDQGDFDSAADEYAQIIDKFPGDWKGQYQYGRCMMELDRLVPAEQAFEIARTLRPESEDVADAMAEVLFRRNELGELFAYLKERAETSKSTRAYLRLARYAEETGDPDSARVALNTAVAMDSGATVEPYLAAADFAIRLGDLDLAIVRLRQAYSIDRRNEQVQQRLRDLGEIPGPTLALPPTD